jgi:hypothetical protein
MAEYNIKTNLSQSNSSLAPYAITAYGKGMGSYTESRYHVADQSVSDLFKSSFTMFLVVQPNNGTQFNALSNYSIAQKVYNALTSQVGGGRSRRNIILNIYAKIIVEENS